MKLSYKIFIISLLLISASTIYSFTAHPYHVGSVEFNFNPKSKTFEITGKFFMDDLENALNKKFGKNVHFLDSKYKEELNKELSQYAIEHLKMKINNKMAKIQYIGYQEDQESVQLFLETEPIEKPKKVEVSASFLYNLFDDQMNIIHIILNGNRKSDRVLFPDRYLYQQF